MNDLRSRTFSKDSLRISFESHIVEQTEPIKLKVARGRTTKTMKFSQAPAPNRKIEQSKNLVSKEFTVNDAG